MSIDKHQNFAYSTIATAPSPALSGTSLTVQSGDGALFPTPPFNATVWPTGVQPLSTNAEIVRVTGISIDTFTIVRAQESTTNKSISTGYQIANTVTDKVLVDAETQPPVSFFENIYGGIGLTTVINATQMSKRPYIIPTWVEGYISQQRTLKYYFSRASGTSLNMTAGFAWYSATNSTQLSLYASESYAVSVTTSASWSGVREMVVGLTNMSSVSLSAGLWWLGMYFNGSNDSTAVQQFNLYGVNRGQSAIVGSVFTGTNQTSATNATNQFMQFAGLYSATQATNTPFPNTIGLSDITGGAGAGVSPTIYFQIIS